MSVCTLLTSTSCFADKWPDIEFPKNANVEVVADNMMIYGNQMRTWVVKVKQSQMQSAAFFKKQWKNKSERFDARIFNGDYVINSLQPPFLLTARIKQEYEQVIIYVGITKAADDKNQRRKQTRFPQLVGTTVMSDINSTDLYKKGRTLMLINKRSIEANYHYYRDYYRRRGWLETSGIIDNSAGNAVLRMNNGTNLLDMSFKKSKSETHIVAIQVMEEQ